VSLLRSGTSFFWLSAFLKNLKIPQFRKIGSATPQLGATRKESPAPTLFSCTTLVQTQPRPLEKNPSGTSQTNLAGFYYSFCSVWYNWCPLQLNRFVCRADKNRLMSCGHDEKKLPTCHNLCPHKNQKGILTAVTPVLPVSQHFFL